jgi:hypothetical protein
MDTGKYNPSDNSRPCKSMERSVRNASDVVHLRYLELVQIGDHAINDGQAD